MPELLDGECRRPEVLLAVRDVARHELLRLRHAARQWRDLGLQFDLALCHLDLLATLGPSAPSARAAADEARLILIGLKAEPFIDRLESLEERTTSVRGDATALRVQAAETA